MKTASPQLYLPQNKIEIKEYFEKDMNERKDTNIGVIGFSFAKEDLKKSLSLGDPIFCVNCGAALNSMSTINSVQQIKKKNLFGNVNFAIIKTQ